MPQIDANVLTAVFGLIGVIVGGAITGGVNYFLEERRANRDEAKEQRKRIIDLKQASRLVDDDFTRALAGVTFAIEYRQWPGPDPMRLETWKEHRSVLAAETTFDDWLALKGAVGTMAYYQRRNEQLDAEALISLEAAKKSLEKGRAALKPYLNLAID